MQIQTEPLLGPAFAALDPNGPTVRVARLTKAELATLNRAADILEQLRDGWNQDDDNQVDVALAGYTIREIIEAKGRVEL